MNLNNYRDETGEFLRNINADDGNIENKLGYLEEEFEILKNSINNPEQFNHQIYDMLFILFEIAYDKDFDLQAEWIKKREKKAKKYI